MNTCALSFKLRLRGRGIAAIRNLASAERRSLDPLFDDARPTTKTTKKSRRERDRARGQRAYQDATARRDAALPGCPIQRRAEQVERETALSAKKAQRAADAEALGRLLGNGADDRLRSMRNPIGFFWR